MAVNTLHFSGFAVNTAAETQYSEHDSQLDLRLPVLPRNKLKDTL